MVKINQQGIIQWNQTYGGNGTDFAFSIIQLEDGGYAVLGTTSSFGAGSVDLWLIKTDSYGNELWNQTYGTVNFDYSYKLLQSRDDGLILIGATFGANNTAFILKIGGSIITSSPTSYSSHFFLFIPLILLYFTKKKRFF